MLSIITIPDNFMASTTATASQFFADMSPVVIVIGGIILGAVVIELIIGALRR